MVKSCPTTAQFQRLVKQLAATAPPGHHESIVPVTLASFERSFSSGYTQTLSLLQAGDQKFIQAFTGNEKMLPPSMRAKKRGLDIEDGEEEEEVEEETPVRAKKSGKDKARKTSASTPARKSRRTCDVEALFTPLAEEDPSPESRTRAPRKSRSHRHHVATEAAEQADEDTDLTETESSVALVLGANVRRSRRNQHATGEVRVKLEEVSDYDLSSLCGGLESIDVQSAIDAESEHGTPAPLQDLGSTLRSGSVRV